MSIFVIINIGNPDAVIDFFKLVENGKCLHDEFFQEAKKNGGHGSDLDYIQAIIERKSLNQPALQSYVGS